MHGHELRWPQWIFWSLQKQHYLLFTYYIPASVFDSPTAQHTASFADGRLRPKEHKRKAVPMVLGPVDATHCAFVFPRLSQSLAKTGPEV